VVYFLRSGLWHKSCDMHSLVVASEKEIHMLRAAIAFFVLGLVAILLGANNIGGLSVDIGKTLLFIFLILAVISFVASLVVGKKIVK
jgi:uncharacterized membrane protein YtjA (UPF0391 family)